MKPIFKTASLLIAILLSYSLHAQPGRSTKVIKQPPKIKGVLKATTNATAKAKIHANSNSVFGTSKTHPKYDKKSQGKKSELKKEDPIDKKKNKK